uniref:CASR n=1 Tax=Poeciliopsis prolifica TaxID=188132 RepID=A0A0S7EJW5_9TELE
MTMAFAVEEINKNPSLLPNVTLGYSLYDNCATLSVGFSAALALASGQEERFSIQESCSGTPPVVGIVGDPFSTFSIAASNVLGLYRLPMVSLPFGKATRIFQSVAGITEIFSTK